MSVSREGGGYSRRSADVMRLSGSRSPAPAPAALLLEPGVVRFEILMDLPDRRGFAGMEGEDPRNADGEIDEVGVGEVVDRRVRYRNDAAHGRDHQEDKRGRAHHEVDGALLAEPLEIDRRRDGDQAIRRDEAEGRERAGIVEDVERRETAERTRCVGSENEMIAIVVTATCGVSLVACASAVASWKMP